MEMEFYDVKSKKKFKVSEFRVVEKKSKTKGGSSVTRYFAVAKSKSGPHECWKVLSKDTAAKLKK